MDEPDLTSAGAKAAYKAIQERILPGWYLCLD